MGKKSTAPLIKGYLPVRVTFPSEDLVDETFFYVKEHFGGDKNTLFVANAPFYPGISTRILLRSLVGRFGDLERVTVVENPRKEKDLPILWTNRTDLYPTFQGPEVCEGKFAHVVFPSQKEMKKALQALEELMSDTNVEYPGLTTEKLEIQTLQDETQRKLYGDDDEDDDDREVKKPLSGIHAVADRYRTSLQAISRETILEECNKVMIEYEVEEEADRAAREAAKNQPDDDGFVTVSYSAQIVGSKRELEEGVTTTNRRKGSKRIRKKKDINGASELQDFYRFQQKETRKRTVQDLRKRFEEDLAKVKEMKEARQYRPFS